MSSKMEATPDPETPAPDYVPQVGCIQFQSKLAAEEISRVSPLWEACWDLLKDADPSKQWMGFLDPVVLDSRLNQDQGVITNWNEG